MTATTPLSSHRPAVGVVGGGRWGYALACAARRVGHPVVLHSRRDNAPEADARGIEVVRDPSALAERCTLVLVAAPSEAMRAVARSLGDVLDGSHLVVHGTRGLSPEGLNTLSDVIRAETPCRRVGALGGPVLADDLIDGRPAVIAVASRYAEVSAAVEAGLGGPMLRVSRSPDLVGLEWASALNGCLFVALGYARAIGVSPGLLGGLLTRGLHEAARVAIAAGADERTFFSLVGIGELLAAMDQDDRPECRLGAALGRGESLEAAQAHAAMRVEALSLLPRVVDFARERRVEATLLGTIAQALEGTMSPQEILVLLMTRR